MSYRALEFDNWQELLASAVKATTEFQRQWNSPSAVPFFRGHASTTYKLAPGLLRQHPRGYYTAYDEQNFYYEFQSRAGSLLGAHLSSWDLLFLMQHHGVPTRLLDWTESLSAALYFALSTASDDVDIWMLDPYALNVRTCGIEDVLDVDTSFQATYFEYFLSTEIEPEWAVAVALYPRRQNPRLASQHGVFTLHSARIPLEETDLPGLTRFRLTRAGTQGAQDLLNVLGVNDFALFPDLDGLARLLRRRFPAQNDISAALD